MRNISNLLDEIYQPVKALVIYESTSEKDKNVYVESFDMDDEGRPLNAHPLTVEEANGLAECLDNTPQLRRSFLKPKGILPPEVLYINPDKNGFVVWFTKAQRENLFFIDKLGIPGGKASIPSMIWKADEVGLSVFALWDNKRPTIKTPLFHAPFFNIYSTGKVCMGTVDVEINSYGSLEEFMQSWQEYFFNSYFSHSLDNYAPVSTNIVSLWKDLINSRKKFPVSVLSKNGQTLKNIIS